MLFRRERVISLVAALCLAAAAECAHASAARDYAPSRGDGAEGAARPAMLVDRSDLLAESFEGAWPPAGWLVLHEGSANTWDRIDTVSNSGTSCAWVLDGPQGALQDEYLVTEAVDLSNLSSIRLSFYEAQKHWPIGGHHLIGVSTTSQSEPNAFAWLVDWTWPDHQIPPTGEGNAPVFTEEEVALDLSGYAGEPVVYVCFRYYSNDPGSFANNWYVDDVRIFEPPAHDIRVLGLAPDGGHFAAPVAVAPRVTVRNQGAADETFDLRVTAAESGLVVYDRTLSVSLAVAAQDTVEFPPLALNPGHYYRLETTALLPDDQIPENDGGDAFLETYTEAHVPLGYLHTNGRSSTCALAEPFLDDYLSGQNGGVAVLRVHTWWPGADPMYLDNPAQTDSLLNANGLLYVPRFWADGFNVGSIGGDFGPALEERKAFGSPALIAMHWNPGLERLTVGLAVVNPLDPSGEYRLFAAIAENDIFYDGGNGYTVHDQVFKHMYPDTQGIAVAPQVGTSIFAIDCPLSIGEVYGEWVFENLSAVVFLQEMNSRRVWQARSLPLGGLIGDLAIAPAAAAVARFDTVTVALTVDPVLLPVKGIEAEIDFDETALRLLGIRAGDWYTESGEGYFFYDYTPAPPEAATSAHFASSWLGGAKADSGAVALLTFVALREGPTPLGFLLAKVRDEANIELNYATSSLDSIHVLPAGDLVISPALTEAETIDRFFVALRIAPIARAVMGVEAEIEFDESVVRLDSIVPGDWYRNSGQGFFFWDYTPAPPDSAGTIHFASALLSAPSAASGDVALFHFSALREGETSLEFLLAKVRDTENTELGFAESVGDSIRIRRTGDLIVEPPLTIVDTADRFSVALGIYPTSREVKGVEADIDFDESVVRLDSIVPGQWYTESGNEFFFWDYTPSPPDSAESIHFASSFLAGTSGGSGQVAVCHFSALRPGETGLRFDLAKVRDAGNTELHFATSGADSILVRSTGSLVIDPSLTTVEALDTFAIDLRIYPRTRAVMGIEAEIDFDATLVRLDSITPGPWFTDSGEGYYFFDYTPAPPDSALSIHFASAFLNAASADSGLVATLHFVARLAGATPLAWDLLKVRDGSNLELNFQASALDSIVVLPRTTAVSDGDPAALGLMLLGNLPNPFNPSTEIHYNLPREAHWSLRVYDVQGRLQRTLFSERRGAGLQVSVWDGRDDRDRALGSGVYLVRLSGAGESRMGKMILLK